MVKDLRNWRWSSYPQYIGIRKDGFCAKEEILSFFKSPKDYEKFVLEQVEYAQKLELIKHQLLEED